MSWLLDYVLGAVPAWAWIVVAGVVLGTAWKVFGWQGMVGGLLAVLTLGAYRQGWRDRDGRDADVVGKRHPVNGDRVIGRVSPPPARKRRTVSDWFKH